MWTLNVVRAVQQLRGLLPRRLRRTTPALPRQPALPDRLPACLPCPCCAQTAVQAFKALRQRSGWALGGLGDDELAKLLLMLRWGPRCARQLGHVGGRREAELARSWQAAAALQPASTPGSSAMPAAGGRYAALARRPLLLPAACPRRALHPEQALPVRRHSSGPLDP